MMGHTPEPKRARLLREYLLSTLPPRRMKRVERELARSGEWRDALDRERAALEALGALPPVTPPPGLAERAIAAAELDENCRKVPPRPRYSPSLGFLFVTAALICALGIVLLPLSSRSREAAKRASSQNNLKQLGVAFKMYAAENNGLYPPRSPRSGVPMFDLARVYPKYLSDLSVLVCPSLDDADEILERMEALAGQDPPDWGAIERLAALSYSYPGWMVRSAEDLRTVQTALAKPTQLATTAHGDIHVAGRTIQRLREGIERFLITDINNPAATASAQSTIPVVFETSPRHAPGGINVLYMDGHVEFLPEGARFPATKEVTQILRSTQ